VEAHNSLWGYRAGDQGDGYFTRLYRTSRDSLFSLRNGFTAYAVLPVDEFVFVTVAAGLTADLIRLDRSRHRQLGTSNGCRDHTVLPYAIRLRQGFGGTSPPKPLTQAETAPFVLRVANRSRINDPPCDCPFAPTLPRPPHPLPRFVTIMTRPSCREKTGKLVDLICPTA